MAWSIGAGLAGRVVLVTGAAGTIGSSVAQAFAEADARVCLVDVQQEPIASLLANLPKRAGAMAISCDLGAADQLQEMFDRVQEEMGGLDVLVHAAAVLQRLEIEEVTEELWDWHMDNNLKAAFFVNRHAARIMREQGRGGRIINFASDAWWTGGLHAATVYATSKGGIVSMSRGLATSLAGYGITVNCVAPGTVDSRMVRSGLSQEQIDHLADPIPMGRLASPDDIASATVFLASSHASFITGTTLNVSGGQLIY
jgi:NAD(P)-dependent dehydrogenase (short-subunit alcohol dehydrogenase family)